MSTFFVRITVFVLAVFFLVPAMSNAASPAKGEPIIIGMPSSLKSLEASEALKAIKLAAEEINAKGGVKVGNAVRPLKVEEMETRDMEPGVPISDALLAIEKLFLEKKPHAVVLGPSRSEVLLAAMDLYAQYKMVSINVAMTPKFIEKYLQNPEKYKYCFRMGDARYVVGYLTKVMEKLKQDFGFTKVYIVVQDVLWSTAIGDGMKGWFEKNKWDVKGYDKYPTGASEFSSTMMKAKQSGAQVIVPIFDMHNSGILVQQWKDMKVPAIMAGFISPLMGSKAWTTFGDKIEGIINVVFQAGNIPLKKYEPSTKFYEAYKKRWGEQQSGHMPSEAYDSVYLLVQAIERAGSLDPDKLVKELEKTDFVGSIGRIKFKDHQFIFGDDPKTSAIAVAYQWKKGGRRVPIFPNSIAEERIDKPSLMK